MTGFSDPFVALASIGGVAAAALVASRRLSGLLDGVRPALLGGAGVAVLYLASGLVVTAFEHGDAVGSVLLSGHQQGQMALSVFWALVGVGAMVVGLRVDVQGLRIAALGLLGVTAGKVFLLDFATLTSVYRVVSFVALGLLLLGGAFAWQRLRPQAGGGSSSS